MRGGGGGGRKWLVLGGFGGRGYEGFLGGMLGDFKVFSGVGGGFVVVFLKRIYKNFK